MIFKRKFLNLLYESDSWLWGFKVQFFPLQSDIPITLLCLIIGVGSVTRVLVVRQKANNVVLVYEITNRGLVGIGCQWPPIIY